jgi:hypothetical protein
MAKFKGLTEVIGEIVKQVEPPLFPQSNPLSVSSGQSQRNISITNGITTGDFRWGFSTWGADVITSQSLPDDNL